MRSESAKPRVVTNTVRSPLRSSSALVATVVPILTASIWLTGSGLAGASPEQVPDALDGGVVVTRRSSDSSLCVTSAPSGRRATMSVKVPPRSIQNCQPARTSPYAPQNQIRRPATALNSEVSSSAVSVHDQSTPR